MKLIQSSPLAFLFVLSLAACGDDSSASSGGGGGGTATGAAQGGGAPSGSGGSATASTNTGSGGAEATTSSAGGGATTSTGSSSSSGTGGGAGLADPNLDGPFTVAQLTGTADSPSGDSIPIAAWYPTAGPEAGPYPVIVIGHGFQLPVTQYASYAARLASHGYVALTADFPAGFVGVNNVDNARDLIAGLDWAAGEPTLAGIADATNAGMTGHSLGGKLALLAATLDARVKATITLDPVDGSMGCNPTDCPDVSNLMPLSIPTGFLGETIDAQGGFQACAPAADNFTTFYAGTTSPSLQVTVNGANHMSFLDDAGSCGFTCSFCNAATAPNDVVNALARAYVVAFYQRHLKGLADYDTYLTGAEAQARYVNTNLVSIASK